MSYLWSNKNFKCDNLCSVDLFDVFGEHNYFKKKFTENRSLVDYKSKKVDGGLALDVDLPGVKKADVILVSEDTQLHIKWNRDGHVNEASFDISDDYDTERCTAKMEDGVLHIVIAPRSPPKGKGTNIKIE